MRMNHISSKAYKQQDNIMPLIQNKSNKVTIDEQSKGNMVLTSKFGPRKHDDIVEPLNTNDFSLFNDQSDAEDIINSKNNVTSNTNKSILKLADDTINFIDQELTKSYKQSNNTINKANSPVKNNLNDQEDDIKAIGRLLSYFSNYMICQIFNRKSLFITTFLDLPKYFGNKPKLPRTKSLRHSKTHKRLRNVENFNNPLVQFQMQSQHETIDNPDNMYNESIGAKIEHNRNSNNLSDMKLKEIEDQFMLKLKEINFLTSVSFK